MDISPDIIRWALAGVGGALVSAILGLAKFVGHIYKETNDAKEELHSNYAEIKEEVGHLRGRQDGVETLAKSVLDEITKLERK